MKLSTMLDRKKTPSLKVVLNPLRTFAAFLHNNMLAPLLHRDSGLLYIETEIPHQSRQTMTSPNTTIKWVRSRHGMFEIENSRVALLNRAHSELEVSQSSVFNSETHQHTEDMIAGSVRASSR
jgi:hypothetical protein